MKRKSKKSKNKSLFSRALILFLKLCFFNKISLGIWIGFFLVFLFNKSLYYTSTDMFCFICHVHPQATYSWKKSTHYKNKSGVVVHCIECHLPPGGIHYLVEKSRLGVRDIYGYYFKDTEKIDWEAKSVREYANTYTYDNSCMRCHDDLYSLELSPKGVQAHEYYMEKKGQIYCINCHLTVGHFQEEPEEIDYLAEEKIEIPSYLSDTGEFANYTEGIDTTEVTFNMIAIPGGTFLLGSPESEPYRNADEGPPCEVRVSSFWMGETEVSWREFEVYYDRTSTGKKDEIDTLPDSEASYDDGTSDSEDQPEVDAVTGPTPPYGAPDQGWGRGSRPVITMTHYTVVKYCEWLSEITGKKYRLPTEAEWEYACRAGTTEPYYFEGDPGKLTKKKWKNRLFGTDDSIINKYTWYKGNSSRKTQPAYTNEPNPWGLYNMLGNVKEFCLDWYTPEAYRAYRGDGPIIDPGGPANGTEHVIRGGSYNSDPSDIRSAARDHTRHDKWMLTDPQSPKSIWWYSDSKDVGFRIVREYDKEL